MADNPHARTIKPKLELVNALVLSRDEVDRVDTAKQLWDLANNEGLTELLGVLPLSRSTWVFDSEDVFLYQRATEPKSVSLAQGTSAWSCEAWQQAMGLVPTQVPLTAEIYAGDWASLVRKEAVRLQKSFNMSAVEQANTLSLPCTAQWDTKHWKVKFDQVEWVVVAYDDTPGMSRPNYAELEEFLTWLIASAGEAQVNKKSAKCDYQPQVQAWADCVEGLRGLHQMLGQPGKDFSPWLVRVWHCVWPIVYREQHVLRERADLDQVRRELKACMEAQPRLCLWMFVFAKLVCQSQVGTGLGFCADYRN